MPSTAAWTALVEHTERCKPARPGKRWWAGALALLEVVGEPAFRARLAEALESATEAPSPGLLVLATRVEPDDRLLGALGARAERGFRRVPGHGPADRPTATL